MPFILAVVDGYRNIYAIHDKIYTNGKQAKNALDKMISKGTLHSDYKVYEIKSFDLKPYQEDSQ
jgi:hypothetical protein